MDPLNSKSLKSSLSEEDACNPLYWYPRNLPEHCYFKITLKPGPKPAPAILPVPLPSQQFPMGPMPPMFPVLPPYPISPGYPMPLPMPMSPPSMPPMPLPFGIPLAPSNPMLPVAGVPAMVYPGFSHYRPQYQVGMVPGIPGMVTHDGGINILPFSDAYADLLEKHKQKMIRKKIKRVLDNYDGYSGRRGGRRRRYRN